MTVLLIWRILKCGVYLNMMDTVGLPEMTDTWKMTDTWNGRYLKIMALENESHSIWRTIKKKAHLKITDYSKWRLLHRERCQTKAKLWTDLNKTHRFISLGADQTCEQTRYRCLYKLTSKVEPGKINMIGLDRQTDRQTDRKADRKTYRQKNR